MLQASSQLKCLCVAALCVVARGVLSRSDPAGDTGFASYCSVGVVQPPITILDSGNAGVEQPVIILEQGATTV